MICSESGLKLDTVEHWRWWLKEKHGLTQHEYDHKICENARINLDVEYHIEVFEQSLNGVFK